MKRGRKKGSIVEFIISNAVGMIEDVYGTSTSFNVYRRLENKLGYKERSFYKSAYNLATALRYLAELA